MIGKKKERRRKNCWMSGIRLLVLVVVLVGVSGRNAMLAYGASMTTYDTSATAYGTSVTAYGQYFYCEDGLLDADVCAGLGEKAAAVSEEYDSGVYMVMVNDYTDWSYDLEEAAEAIFLENGMGMRDDSDGIVLILSMSERDYILMSHGVFASQAYSDDAKTAIENAFLDDFGDDDFEAGFFDYIEKCGEMLQLAADGTPYSKGNLALYPWIKWGSSLVLGVIGGLLIALFARSRMKSVARETRADQYLSEEGVTITGRQDLFTHVTEHRVRIQKDNNSSGGSAGGFSSHSGKF